MNTPFDQTLIAMPVAINSIGIFFWLQCISWVIDQYDVQSFQSAIKIFTKLLNDHRSINQRTITLDLTVCKPLRISTQQNNEIMPAISQYTHENPFSCLCNFSTQNAPFYHLMLRLYGPQFPFLPLTHRKHWVPMRISSIHPRLKHSPTHSLTPLLVFPHYHLFANLILCLPDNLHRVWLCSQGIS